MLTPEPIYHLLALTGLTSISAHCLQCSAVLMEALLLHLDVTAPAAAGAQGCVSAGCSAGPWQAAAAVLLQLGFRVLDVVHKLQKAMHAQASAPGVGVMVAGPSEGVDATGRERGSEAGGRGGGGVNMAVQSTAAAGGGGGGRLLGMDPAVHSAAAAGLGAGSGSRSGEGTGQQQAGLQQQQQQQGGQQGEQQLLQKLSATPEWTSWMHLVKLLESRREWWGEAVADVRDLRLLLLGQPQPGLVVQPEGRTEAAALAGRVPLGGSDVGSGGALPGGTAGPSAMAAGGSAGGGRIGTSAALAAGRSGGGMKEAAAAAGQARDGGGSSSGAGSHVMSSSEQVLVAKAMVVAFVCGSGHAYVDTAKQLLEGPETNTTAPVAVPVTVPAGGGGTGSRSAGGGGSGDSAAGGGKSRASTRCVRSQAR